MQDHQTLHAIASTAWGGAVSCTIYMYRSLWPTFHI